jgi:hypothetical protein
MNGLLLPTSHRPHLHLPAGTSGGHLHRVSPDGEGIVTPSFRELVNLGIIPAISGGARGYATAGDVLTQTVDGRSLNDIWSEFAATLDLHNNFRQALIDLLSFNVNAPIEDVPQVTGDDFEEASEFGIPKSIRGGDYFSMGYDFKWYDLRIAYTWQYLAEASAAQVESLNNMALEADNRLMFGKVLRAVFNNVTRVANIRQQNVNVYPFYNGDATVPPAFKTYVHAGAHQHYLVSGAATVDFGDLDEMETHLKHHGYGSSMGSNLILLANSQQINTMRSFRVATGASYDFIASQGSAPYLLPTNTGGVVGSQPPAQYQGLQVAGRYGNWLIVEEDFVPAGYLVGFATGGTLNATNPVGIRQHANSGLRGLRLIKGNDNDYPLIDSYYNHGFGTGVRHRGAGVVMQIKAAGGFDIPAAYV